MQQQIKEREYIDIDEQIRVAKERQAKGEPGAAEQLRQLQQQKKELKHEIRQAGDKDYVREHNERKQKKKTLQKVIECEL